MPFSIHTFSTEKTIRFLTLAAWDEIVVAQSDVEDVTLFRWTLLHTTDHCCADRRSIIDHKHRFLFVGWLLDLRIDCHSAGGFTINIFVCWTTKRRLTTVILFWKKTSHTNLSLLVSPVLLWRFPLLWTVLTRWWWRDQESVRSAGFVFSKWNEDYILNNAYESSHHSSQFEYCILDMAACSVSPFVLQSTLLGSDDLRQLQWEWSTGTIAWSATAASSWSGKSPCTSCKRCAGVDHTWLNYHHPHHQSPPLGI